MNETGQKIYNFISNKDLSKSKSFVELIKKMNKRIDPIFEVFKEVLFSDEKTFRSYYAMNFIDSEKFKIVSDILGVNEDAIKISPMRDEVVRFTVINETYDILSKIYESARYACNITLEEFCASYVIILGNGLILDIFVNKKLDSKLLAEDIRKAYEQEQNKENKIASMFERLATTTITGDDDGEPE